MSFLGKLWEKSKGDNVVNERYYSEGTQFVEFNSIVIPSCRFTRAEREELKDLSVKMMSCIKEHKTSVLLGEMKITVLISKD